MSSTHLAVWLDRLTNEAIEPAEINDVYEDIQSVYGKGNQSFEQDVNEVYFEAKGVFSFLIAVYYKYELRFRREKDGLLLYYTPRRPPLFAEKVSSCKKLNVFVEDVNHYGLSCYAPFFAFCLGHNSRIKIINEIDNREYDLQAIQKQNAKFYEKRSKDLQPMSKGVALSIGLTNTKVIPTARKRYLDLVYENLTPAQLKSWESYSNELRRIEKRAKEEPLFTRILFAFCTLYQKQWGARDCTFIKPVIVEKSEFDFTVFVRQASPYEQNKVNKILEEFQGFETKGTFEPFLRSVREDGGRLLRLTLNPLAVMHMGQYFLCPYNQLHKEIDGKGKQFIIACERLMLYMAINLASTGKPIEMSFEYLQEVMYPEAETPEIGTNWIYKNIRSLFNILINKTAIVDRALYDREKQVYRIYPNKECFSNIYGDTPLYLNYVDNVKN